MCLSTSQFAGHLIILRRTLKYGYGSIPINTIFSGIFTSINPSYDLGFTRGTRVLTHPQRQNLGTRPRTGSGQAAWTSWRLADFWSTKTQFKRHGKPPFFDGKNSNTKQLTMTITVIMFYGHYGTIGKWVSCHYFDWVIFQFANC